MRVLGLAVLVGVALAIAGAGQAKTSSSHSRHGGRQGPPASGTRGEFDYYVMALSWSPTFCELHPDEEEQCAHKGYGFVLHGLWPQYDGGGGPENCPTTDEVDKKTAAAALAFMPSRSLINHEWRAHGACTGLGAPDYFALADRAFAAVRMPSEFEAPSQPIDTTADDVRSALKRANPELTDEMMSLHCSRGELVEIRVCLNKDVALQECGKRMQSHCPATARITMPASQARSK